MILRGHADELQLRDEEQRPVASLTSEPLAFRAFVAHENLVTIDGDYRELCSRLDASTVAEAVKAVSVTATFRILHLDPGPLGIDGHITDMDWSEIPEAELIPQVGKEPHDVLLAIFGMAAISLIVIIPYYLILSS